MYYSKDADGNTIISSDVYGIVNRSYKYNIIKDNANILLDLVRKNKSIRGVSWGHIHNVFETNINNARLFSTPSTCYQSKPKSETFTL